MLTDAEATGERLTTLRTLRARLARDLDACQSARDVIGLSKRLMDVMAEIDDLGGGVVPVKKETALDEFTKRLVGRQPTSTLARRAAGG